jgi:hypothetical protein
MLAISAELVQIGSLLQKCSQCGKFKCLYLHTVGLHLMYEGEKSTFTFVRTTCFRMIPEPFKMGIFKESNKAERLQVNGLDMKREDRDPFYLLYWISLRKTEENRKQFIIRHILK